MELWNIQNGELIAQSSEKLSDDEIHHLDNSHAMFNDQRLYKGEKKQDDEVTKSISVTGKAQKNWPRKCFQFEENKNYESAMMC